MSDEIAFEYDTEGAKVRRYIEAQYVRAGIQEFVAFRLALMEGIDWHQVVRLKDNGATDEDLVRIYLD